MTATKRMNWQELLAQFNQALSQALSGETDPAKQRAIKEAATAALLADARQHLINTGFAASHADHTSDKKAWEAEKGALQQQIQTLQTQLDDAKKGGKGDARIAELEAQIAAKEKALADKDAEWKAKYEQLEGEFTGSIRQSFITKLENRLVSTHGVDAEIVSSFIQKHESRIRTEKDRTVKVYQADGQTPIIPPAGRELYEVLADEIAQTIPARFKDSKVPSGSGASGQGGSGGSGLSDEEITKRRRTSVAGSF